ncbi:MAG: hypothetical protein J1F04_09500 [Oscillospiraceae bacterium]|nr:hypothetical protein [Oscillospiraceae bacterium]
MFIVLHVNEKLQPKHRFSLEDYISEVLEKNGLGEVTGGGTLMEKNGEVNSCDIDIELSDEAPNALERFKKFIGDLNIAKGSALKIADSDDIPVGKFEGMGLYLSNDLPDEVYENNDINDLLSRLREAIGEAGDLRSWCEKEFTALYYYGDSFDEMSGLAKPVLDSHPLGKDCKVVRLA